MLIRVAEFCITHRGHFFSEAGCDSMIHNVVAALMIFWTSSYKIIDFFFLNSFSIPSWTAFLVGPFRM